MTILSKACKPHKFELHCSLKLRFTNIWGLCSNFVDCKSFLQSNSESIFPSAKIGWISWFWQFLCESLSSFNQKNSVTHMHSLAVYVKQGLPFAHDISLENSANFWLALLNSLSFFIFLYWWPLSLYTVFYPISSTIDEVLWINSFANVFVLRVFSVHHKD